MNCKTKGASRGVGGKRSKGGERQAGKNGKVLAGVGGWEAEEVYSSHGG